MDTFPFIYVRVAPSTWAYLSSLLMLALFFKFNRFWSVRNFDLCLIILLAPGLLLIEGGRQWEAQNKSVAVSASDLAQSPEKNIPPSGSQLSDDSELKIANPQDQELPRGEQKGAGEKELNLDSKGVVWQRLGYYWLFSIGGLILIRMLIDPSLTRRPQLEPNLAIGGMVFFGFSLMMFLFAQFLRLHHRVQSQYRPASLPLSHEHAVQFRLTYCLLLAPNFMNHTRLLSLFIEFLTAGNLSNAIKPR